MTKQKENLNKLVEFIGMLLEQEGNEWLVDALLKVIETKMPLEQIAKHSVIVNIHEYCIEEKIKKQASEFYGDFKIDEIKPQLIKDYEKMEHERRRDDFENFCLSLFQQVEGVVNFLFDNHIQPVWDSKRMEISILKYDSTSRKYTRPSVGKPLEKLVFEDSTKTDWYFNRKCRAVLYFFFYNREVQNEFDFNRTYYMCNDLYQVRNKNHRGSKPNDYQAKILEKIEGVESKYYFRFHGFLEDFMDKINLNIPSTLPSKKIAEKPKNLKKITFGDNPELDKLKDLFKK